MKPTISVDWDGTLVPSRWPERPLEWLPGALDALWTLQTFARVVIHTCRIAPVDPSEQVTFSPEKVAIEVNYIRGMLDEAGLTMVEIHQKPWKPSAVAYVDDRGVHYSGRKDAWKHLVPKLAVMCGVKEEVVI